jgi:hypothetical protein
MFRHISASVMILPVPAAPGDSGRPLPAVKVLDETEPCTTPRSGGFQVIVSQPGPGRDGGAGHQVRPLRAAPIFRLVWRQG